MMRSLSYSGILACVLVLTLPVKGQISTFPSPPPLPPPVDNSVVGSAPGQTAANQNSRPGTEPSGTSTETTSPATPAATAETLTSMEALDDQTKLGKGDTISFRVIEDRDKAVQLLVSDNGDVNFPYINRVKVEGKTCHQVALDVKKLLEVDYYKRATVIIGLDLINDFDKTKPKDMAWVMGEVRAVGPLELYKNQTTTVSQLIMRAGGFGDFADQRKVKVIHHATDANVDVTNAKNFELVDVKAVFKGQSAKDPVVAAGDYIIVPKKVLNFGD